MGEKNGGSGGGNRNYNPWALGAAIAGAFGLMYYMKFKIDSSYKINYGNITDSNVNSNNNTNYDLSKKTSVKLETN